MRLTVLQWFKSNKWMIAGAFMAAVVTAQTAVLANLAVRAVASDLLAEKNMIAMQAQLTYYRNIWSGFENAGF